LNFGKRDQQFFALEEHVYVGDEFAKRETDLAGLLGQES
jgi:hypothetical protein